MLDARFSHLYFCQSLNRLQRGLSAIAELLVQCWPRHQSIFVYYCHPVATPQWDYSKVRTVVTGVNASDLGRKTKWGSLCRPFLERLSPVYCRVPHFSTLEILSLVFPSCRSVFDLFGFGPSLVLHFPVSCIFNRPCKFCYLILGAWSKEML